MMNTKPRTECEREHDFALVLSGMTELTPEVQDALFEAGCDDATISVRAGRVYLTFSRNSRSLKDAILTAIQDVKNARVGADVLRVDVCNLVTQADIARKIGRSRQTPFISTSPAFEDLDAFPLPRATSRMVSQCGTGGRSLTRFGKTT